jgi:hypothetical protein
VLGAGADPGRRRGAAAQTEAGGCARIEGIARRGILGAGEDQLGGGEDPVGDPAHREERHHLALLEIGDEGVGEHSFERCSDLDADLIGVGIDP